MDTIFGLLWGVVFASFRWNRVTVNDRELFY